MKNGGRRDMKKSTGIWAAAACLFAGAVIGFLLAPIKGGIGNYSGNTTKYYTQDQPQKEEPEEPAQ